MASQQISGDLARKSQRSNWTVIGLGVSAMFMMVYIYLLAPLSNEISNELSILPSLQILIIPSIVIPIGISCFFKSNPSKPFNPRSLMLRTLATLTVLSILTAICKSALIFFLIRITFGLLLGKLLPGSLKLIVSQFDSEKRVQPVLTIIFSMATGMTFGPVLGALFYEKAGWRIEFLCLGSVCLAMLMGVIYYSRYFTGDQNSTNVLKKLKGNEPPKAWNGYYLIVLLFILINAVFHSGLFIWTGELLVKSYDLGKQHLGWMLLDFGLPGLILIVILAALSSKSNMFKSELIGLVILLVCFGVLLFQVPLWLMLIIITIMSVGYNMTQPLFFGLIGRLDSRDLSESQVKAGCGVLFIGYGLGPILFGRLLLHNSIISVFFLLFLFACLAVVSLLIFKKKSLIK